MPEQTWSVENPQIKALIKASNIINSTLDFSELLRLIMDEVTNVMHAEAGSVYLLDTDTNELVIETAQGPVGEKLKGLRFKIPDGICGWVANSGETVIIPDASKDPRFNPKPDQETKFVTRSVVCVPMKYKDHVTGVMQVINKSDGGEFTPTDADIFKIFASYAAIAIENASQYHFLYKENRLLREELAESSQIIGKSSSLRKVLHTINKIAPSDSTVVIQGESGTGKELVARAIHQLSNRSKSPFVPVNCGALSENLLESELFGHEKGSFTGAITQRKGLFEEANSGTVFLDEINETSPATQVKLLRVIQEGKIKRIGSNKEIDVDVRVIAATNKNLYECVQQKKFREDLFYRLNVVNINVPPLRERVDDLPLLVNHFVKKYSQKMKKNIERVESEVMEKIFRYLWPGNIRELENVIESAIAMADPPSVKLENLPANFQEKIRFAPRQTRYSDMSYEQAKELFEQEYFYDLLRRAKGNVKFAAEKAGVSEKSVSRRKQHFEFENKMFTEEAGAEEAKPAQQG